MNNTSLALQPPAQFATDAGGKPTAVTMDTTAYIALLVRANVTDPEFWPPGTQEGAAALARIRPIEADCLAQHGENKPPALERSVMKRSL